MFGLTIDLKEVSKKLVMDDLFFSYKSTFDDRYSVVVEDDGRVAYAYLLLNDDIVSEVWLYNRQRIVQQNWDAANMPFINPDEYLDTANSTVPIQNSNDVAVEWRFDSNLVIALVYVHLRLVAALKEDSRPGWSTSVIKDGPLANMYRPNYF